MNSVPGFWNRYWHWVLFTLMLVTLYWFTRAGELLSFRPLGEHTWANCDRASVAWNYYKNGASFFEPQTQSVVDNPSAIASGEFPLMPWLASLLYRVFGYSEFWFRLLTFLASITGFYFAFALCNRMIRDKMLVLAAASLWPCSTYLIYYSTGFLPDNVSLSCLIIALYIALKNGPPYAGKTLAGISFFASLAMLLKTSAAFLYAPMAFALLVLIWQNEKKIRSLVKPALALAVPVGIMLCWILFSKHIQEKYHSIVFLLKPKMPDSSEHYKALLGQFFDRSANYYNSALLLVMCGCLAGFVFLRKQLKSVLHLIWAGGIIAWFVFFWILGRNAWFHSYYHIPFFFIFFVFFLGFFTALDKINLSSNVRISILTAVIGLFLFSVMDLREKLQPVAFRLQLEKADWYGAGDAIRKMGVPDSAIIFSCEDPSPNVSLYFMQFRGWTSLNHFWPSYKTKALAHCDYAVLSDTSLVHDSACARFFENKIGSFRSLTVYKIRKSGTEK